MFGGMRNPFGNAADLHTQPQHQNQHRPATVTAAAVAAASVLGHGHYPNYHLYNVPAGHGHSHGHSHGHGHGHVVVGPALAHLYAAGAAPTIDSISDHHRVHDATEELFRRRGSGERRGSGSLRRNSGSGTGTELTQGAPGKKQQRFEILRKLGSGTYGRVSLAMDHKAGEEVAVKVIRKSAIENVSDLIRIRREIKIMSALKHPNIIEIKEVFENDEKIILVMEYASGGELYDYVGKHGPLPEDEVRRLFRQVVSAVYYCHKHGVAHRDLKLENILLDKDLGAKIADFGLSNYFTEYSKLRTFCGSPLYASPEIINGTPYRGPEVDCWSLGVLLYTLAYSSMPFDGRDFNRMSRQIKRGAYYEPDPPSSASMLIRSMLRVCPERRATISDIAAHWWLNFDENGLAIADMPENQVLDATPLYTRQETMLIQSFGEENEMFAEFTHLSEATRKKIEEYRRRRREAEWYLTECQTPLKKQSKKRSSSIVNDQQKRQSSQAMAAQKQSREASVVASGADVAAPRKDSNAAESPKAVTQQDQKESTARHYTAAEVAAGEAGGVPDDQLLDNLSDPLNRLKALETRLNKQYQKEKANSQRVGDVEVQLPEGVARGDASAQRPLTERPPSGRGSASAASTPKKLKTAASLKMSVDDLVQEKRALDKAVDNATAASVVSAIQEEANRMVNQLLEEAMKGVVSPDMVETIRDSEAYRAETFVKEILESVLAAQQAKPTATPSTPTTRGSRYKAKQSSLTRIPKSSSSSSAAPLPDVIRQNSDTAANAAVAAAPPDIVAAVAEAPMQPAPTPQTPPVTAGAAQKKLIYETVPEDAELQLAAAVDGEIVADPPSTPASSEQEEDVCSTDFEDLDIDEEEAEAARERRGEESPLSGTGSFTSTHSQVGELPEIRTFAPAEGGEGQAAPEAAEGEDNPFLRGLSKRLSRGKYERSKYVLGRGVSIEESPRSSRRRLAAEKRANQAGQGSLEENETENTEPIEAEESVADGAKSPRRRYSDGDKNHLEPLARKEDWLQKSDSELGSSQEIDSPKPDPEMEGKTAPAAEMAKEKAKVKVEKKHKEKEKRRTVKAAQASEVAPALPAPPEKAALPSPPQLPALPAPVEIPALPAPVQQQALPEPIQAAASPAPESPVQPGQDEIVASNLLSESQRRREERAKLKKGLRTESAPPPEPATPSPTKAEPQQPPSAGKKKVACSRNQAGKPPEIADPQKGPEIADPQQQPSSERAAAKQTDKAPAPPSTEQAPGQNQEKPKDDEAKVPASIEDPKHEGSATLEAPPPKKKEIKKTKRRTPAAAVAVATIKIEKAESVKAVVVAESKEMHDAAPPSPSDQQKPDQKQEGEPERTNREEKKPDEQAPDPSPPADPPPPSFHKSAEQRRISYRSAKDENRRSQEGDRSLPKSPNSSSIDHYTGAFAPSVGAGAPRSAKYHQSPAGVVTASAVPEPYWLQYAREETHKHQAGSSPYHHGYGAGDYKSSIGHGFDDDHLITRTSHLPQSSSYRVGNSYSTRDLSPPRAIVAPVFRSHVDPVDTTLSSYAPYGHQSSIVASTNRGRKPRPLYHQRSSDDLGSHHLDDSVSAGLGSKRFSIPTNAVVAGYTPAYSRRTTGSGDYYKPLYDDNSVYRRHYDAQPEPEDDWKPGSEKESGDGGSSGNRFRVFQPKGLMKRRSRSLDKSQGRRGLPADADDDHADPPLSYVNYHDTGSHHYQPAGVTAGRYDSSARQFLTDAGSKSPLKSILKKQTTLDNTTTSGAYGRYGEPERKNSDGDGSRATTYLDRFRRKSPEPPDCATVSSNSRSKNESAIFAGSGDNSALVDYGSSGLYADGIDGKNHKKRMMQMGRRRTTEIRYGGSDGVSGLGDDYLYGSGASSKRPASPTEKTKSYFSSSSAKPGPPNIGGTNGPNPYHYSAMASPFATYQPSATGANATRDFAGMNPSGYNVRKPYPATTTYRPTSYAPSSRYWHDDSSMH